MSSRKKVVVIGGGFAGIQAVKDIDENLYDVLLIDKINHHQFQPLFYQVATSQLEPASISFPLRNIFKKKKNLQIRLAEVTSIDTDRKKITTTIGEFDYDYVVLAIGCTTNFFGNNEIKQHAFTLKTTYDAIQIRNHILQTFELAISTPEEEKQGLLNLVIVGAGPTGVELAGAFAEIKKNVLPKDYPGIDFSHFNVYLIEGSKHTLNNLSDKAKISSEKYLKEMGVNIKTETIVKNYDGTTLELNSGERIITKTVIWAAGVTGNVVTGLPEESKKPGNRILVNRLNQVQGLKDIYAVGDIAYMETPKYPKGHPQVANVAINQAKNMAKNFNAMAKGKTLKEYEYVDLGSMATVGRNKAVVDLPFVRFNGYPAWLVWMFLHLMLILGARNKLIIFINWAWAYMFKDTSLRLILKPQEKKR